jgi:hypothetical protein
MLMWVSVISRLQFERRGDDLQPVMLAPTAQSHQRVLLKSEWSGGREQFAMEER